MARIKQHLVERRADWVALLLLVMLGVRFLAGVNQVIDIILWDESHYLYDGVRLLQAGFRDSSWGPLYTLWYFLLSVFVQDRFTLYYLNTYLLILLPPLAVYLLLRSNQVPLWWSWIAAAVFLWLAMNYKATPRVTQFAVLVILLTLTLMSRAPSLVRALLYACIGMLLVIFLRPEQTITLGLVILFTLVFILSQRRTLKRADWYIAAATVALFGIFFFTFGTPFTSPLSNFRSFDAFRQHVVANWATHTDANISAYVNYNAQFAVFFPNSRTLLQALAENPGAVLRHIRWNVSELLTALPTLPFSTFFFEPPRSRLNLALLVAALALLFVIRRRIVIENLKQRWLVLGLLGVILATTLVSALVILPRLIYLVMPATMLMCGLFILLLGGTVGRTPRIAELVVAALFALALVPSLASVAPPSVPNAWMIQTLKKINPVKPLTILSTAGHVEYYLDNPSRIVDFTGIESRSLESMIQKDGINVITLTREILNDTRYNSAPDWQRFVESPESFGFVRYQAPRSDNLLFVHQSLLTDPSP